MLLGTFVHAQDLKPAVRWNAEGAGDWAADGNWVLSGSDPAEEGVPEKAKSPQSATAEQPRWAVPWGKYLTLLSSMER